MELSLCFFPSLFTVCTSSSPLLVLQCQGPSLRPALQQNVCCGCPSLHVPIARAQQRSSSLTFTTFLSTSYHFILANTICRYSLGTSGYSCNGGREADCRSSPPHALHQIKSNRLIPQLCRKKISVAFLSPQLLSLSDHTLCILSDHHELKLDIINRRNSRKHANSWKLNNSILNEKWVRKNQERV